LIPVNKSFTITLKHLAVSQFNIEADTPEKAVERLKFLMKEKGYTIFENPNTEILSVEEDAQMVLELEPVQTAPTSKSVH